jgi:hypothetical protein
LEILILNPNNKHSQSQNLAEVLSPQFCKKAETHKTSVSQEKQQDGSVFYIIHALEGSTYTYLGYS